MKKIVLVVSLILALSVFFGACAKKESNTETTSATQIISTTKEPKETFGDFLGTVVPGKFTSTEAEEFYYLLIENFSRDAESVDRDSKYFIQEDAGIKIYEELMNFCSKNLQYLDSIPWKARPIDTFSGDDSFAKLSENCSIIVTQRGYGTQSVLLRYNIPGEETAAEILLLKDYNVPSTERVEFSGRYLSYLDGFFFNGQKLECDLVPISHMSDFSTHGNNEFILCNKENKLFFLVSRPDGSIEEILIGEYLDDITPFQYQCSVFFLGTDGNVVQADLEKGFSVSKTVYDGYHGFTYGLSSGSYVFICEDADGEGKAITPETYIDFSGVEKDYQYELGV